MSCFTTDPLPPLQERAIDHVAGTPDLQCIDVQALPKRAGKLQLSGHTGIVCKIKKAAA